MNPRLHYQLGLRMGLILGLLAWLLYNLCFADLLQHVDFSLYKLGVFRVYRGVGCAIFGLWLWGLALYVWTQNRINWMYLFQLDPARTWGHLDWWQHAATWTLVFLVNFLVFFKVARGELYGIPSSGHIYLPLGLVLVLLIHGLATFCPSVRGCGRSCRASNRGWLWSFRQVWTSPVGEVTFNTSFMADCFTSIARINSDFAFIFCYYLSLEFANSKEGDGAAPGERNRPSQCADSTAMKMVVVPIICALPQWIRLMQMLRRYRNTLQKKYLVNAFKYSLSHVIIVFGAMNPSLKPHPGAMQWDAFFFLFFTLISSLFGFTWDTFNTWHIFELSPAAPAAVPAAPAAPSATLSSSSASSASTHRGRNVGDASGRESEAPNTPLVVTEDGGGGAGGAGEVGGAGASSSKKWHGVPCCGGRRCGLRRRRMYGNRCW
jgi:hypothetical protein